MNYYKNIVEVIENENKNNKDIYTELIKTEENVLKTINNVINHNNKLKLDDLFLDKSLSDILNKMIATSFEIYKDIFIVKSYKSLDEVFLSRDRKIYVGIMLIIVGLLIFIVFVS